MSHPSIKNPPGIGTQSGVTSSAPMGYFVDHKKGEVNELKQLLKNINVERDVRRKRDIIKKVIAYMTLGIDVSRLFTDMIMAIETKDIVVKKMVYLYLCNYAHKQPDMAIMCINTLRRDCDNEDPLVRGLALRSLCNLRMISIIEYVEQPLRKALADLSPYVRKTGVVGVLKLYTLSKEFVEDGKFIESLYTMLQDIDTSVISNVIMVLEEILSQKTGGLKLSQGLMIYLLGRLGEFSEWGLNAVLELVSRYQTSSEAEIFAIMNLLDPVLRSSNSCSVLAVLKCFLHFTDQFPELQPQVYIRIKPPLLTMITGGSPEIQYVLLKHLEMILNQPSAANVFNDEFRQLFIRYNEPTPVKYIKVSLLCHLVNTANTQEILAELYEYVTDMDRELAVSAITAISNIALKIPSMAPYIIEKLIELMDLEVEHIRTESIRSLAFIVKKYPQLKAPILPQLPKYLAQLDDSPAKTEVVWLIGEFGEEIEDAPYLLEPVAKSYAEQSYETKLELLTAILKLFFKRPPETVAILGNLLTDALNDSSHQDLRDRALFYYRALQHDLELASNLCLSRASSLDGIHRLGAVLGGNVERLVYRQLNSLSVVFGQPSSEFIQAQYLTLDSESGAMIDQSPLSRQVSGGITTSPVVSTNGTSAVDKSESPSCPFQLTQGFVMSASVFQALWSSVDSREYSAKRVCQLAGVSASTSCVENALSAAHIYTMASGSLPPPLSGCKLFLYCLCQPPSADLLTDAEVDLSPFHVLLQLTYEIPSGDVNVVTKSDNKALQPIQIEQFLVHLVTVLATVYSVIEICQFR